jgi:hypothetical protein
MSETQYDLIEAAPAHSEAVARLWSWSENYDYPTPATLFLDLIGYSVHEYGEPLISDMAEIISKLGYLEIDMLADALKEYADRPGDVMPYVERLATAE